MTLSLLFQKVPHSYSFEQGMILNANRELSFEGKQSVKTITSSVKTISKSTKGTWGKSGVQKAVKKPFKEAAIKAEEKGEIRYKQTFKLLKVVFPNGLK